MFLTVPPPSTSHLSYVWECSPIWGSLQVWAPQTGFLCFLDKWGRVAGWRRLVDRFHWIRRGESWLSYETMDGCSADVYDPEPSPWRLARKWDHGGYEVAAEGAAEHEEVFRQCKACADSLLKAFLCRACRQLLTDHSRFKCSRGAGRCLREWTAALAKSVRHSFQVAAARAAKCKTREASWGATEVSSAAMRAYGPGVPADERKSIQAANLGKRSIGGSRTDSAQSGGRRSGRTGGVGRGS